MVMKERITIVAPAASTFVMRDIELLSERYEVTVCLLPTRMGIEVLTRMAELIWNISRSKAVISWFADASYYPTKICRFLGKGNIVIIAGYDVASIPEIGYGALIDDSVKERVEWVLRNATMVVAVDHGLVEDLKRNFSNDFGARVIPTGYDHEKYRPGLCKEPMVLSVCSAAERRGLVKGIDILAECARRMPDVPFLLIGTKPSAVPFMGEVPSNMRIIEQLPPDGIIPYYQRAKVYCQLSMREGLPNAVCEAMLCDCVVVGSDVQGIRTAVGDEGFLVPYGDIDATCDAIRKALMKDRFKGRERIMSNFTLERRKESLLRALEEVIT